MAVQLVAKNRPVRDQVGAAEWAARVELAVGGDLVEPLAMQVVDIAQPSPVDVQRPAPERGAEGEQYAVARSGLGNDDLHDQRV